MSSEKDGGPAFPGITLRDWFAGQVLQGMLSETLVDPNLPTLNDVKVSFGQFYVRRAYSWADIMLAERESK